MTKPVVVLAEELSPAAVSVLSADAEVRQVDGTDRPALLAALADADGLVVRSATRVDREAIAAGGHLRVVARAGVGLDNIDVDAATEAGVMVVNAPTSNIVSAAEQAVALLLACCRNVAAADASLRRGEWTRSRFTGVELEGKTLGVVGFGRIGQLVAGRMAAFGMVVVAYDPYVPPARIAQLGARAVGLDELLKISDVVTIHLPRTKETLGIIGERELSIVEPGVRLVNAARGGLVDEHALYQALKDGRVAAAGIDVWAVEPCTDSPLLEFPQVVVAPHLGASTVEAQDKAGLAVARSVRLALRGEFVPDAVNVRGGAVAEDVRPLLPLTEKLGRALAVIADGPLSALDVEVRGEVCGQDVTVLQLAALKGLLSPVVEEQVSYVNAPLLAAARGLAVTIGCRPEDAEYRNLVTLHGTRADGSRVRVAGTVSGPRSGHKLVGVLDYPVEVDLAGYLAFLVYHDRPGVVGAIGTTLGEAGVNIAGMQVARDAAGGHALMVLSLDSEIDTEQLAAIRGRVGAHLAAGGTVDVD